MAARGPTAAPARWTDGVRREVLPNGLTLLVQEDRSAPVVAVVTHVRAGFFDEPDRWTGISHVLEHMFFKGTERRGVGAIARETKSAGGYLNASTSYDHTSYFTVLPASGLAKALDIQADALRHSVIDAGELARELQVIIQEAKRKLDTPGAVAYETLHEVMFDRHRIRRWRIGHEEQLAGFTRADVHGYYASRYVPARTIVAIVGAVDAEGALAQARQTYGGWPPAAGAVDPSPEEPPRREVRTRTLRGDVTQAELTLGWRAAPPLAPDAPALDLAAAVLGAGTGQLALSRPARARTRHLGQRALLRADRARGCSGSRRRSRRRGCRPRSMPWPRPWPGSPCSVRRPRTSSAPARCCGRAGRAGSSPWRAAPPHSPRPRRWTATPFSTASSRRWRRSGPTRSEPPPPAISSPTPCPPCSTCRGTKATSSLPRPWNARSR